MYNIVYYCKKNLPTKSEQLEPRILIYLEDKFEAK